MKKTARGSRPYFVVSMSLMLVGNRLAYGLGRLLGQGRFHHDLTMPADALFPFLPWTISVYFGCFLFWAAIYRVVSRRPRRESDRFFLAGLLAKGVCFLFFALLPTTNIRPEVTGTTVWDGLMRFLYRIDAPDNLFPSIHCMVSWLCWVGVRGKKDISVVWRGAALLMAVAVCLSTLTTRQHVLADAAGGILLGEFSYWIAGLERLLRGYSALVDRLLRMVPGQEKIICYD